MKLNSLVREIIENNSITKQTDITDILLKQYNINVTQSNISRILKQIKAVKVVNQNKEVLYEIQEKLTDISSWIKKFVKKIDDNGSLITVAAYPGSAYIIGQAIDEKNVENIMGTISGDNTLLIVPKNVSKIKELRNELEKILL